MLLITACLGVFTDNPIFVATKGDVEDLSPARFSHFKFREIVDMYPPRSPASPVRLIPLFLSRIP